MNEDENGWITYLLESIGAHGLLHNTSDGEANASIELHCAKELQDQKDTTTVWCMRRGQLSKAQGALLDVQYH